MNHLINRRGGRFHVRHLYTVVSIILWLIMSYQIATTLETESWEMVRPVWLSYVRVQFSILEAMYSLSLDVSFVNRRMLLSAHIDTAPRIPLRYWHVSHETMCQLFAVFLMPEAVLKEIKEGHHHADLRVNTGLIKVLALPDLLMLKQLWSQPDEEADKGSALASATAINRRSMWSGSSLLTNLSRRFNRAQSSVITSASPCWETLYHSACT